MLLKGSSGDIYEAHHTLVISEEVILVGEHKLLVGQGHVSDSGPKTRPEPQGKQVSQRHLPPCFLGHFSPVLRHLFAVLLQFPASWRQDGENGRRMA